MKILRKVLILFITAALILSLSGCFGIYKKIFDGITGNSGETQSIQNNDNTTVTLPAEQETLDVGYTDLPSAGGEERTVYNLHFEVPEGTVNNPYSGMLGVWEYYTTDYGQPGMDLTVVVSDLGERTAKEYVENDSRPAHSTGVTPFKEEKINGCTWYSCNNGEIYYFAAENGGYIFEIEVKSVGNDPLNLRDTTINMLRMTLKFIA